MEALKRGLNPAPSHLLVKRDKTPLQLLVEEMKYCLIPESIFSYVFWLETTERM